jgi:phosphonate transport system substrate-binding protein
MINIHKKTTLFFILTLFFLLTSLPAQTNTNTITIGIAPHSSTRAILETHQDLRIFLENFFQRPVEILTAKNFTEFAKRSNEGNHYDLIITSPNLAILAQKNASYTPLITYTKGLSTVILSKNKDILKSNILPLNVVGLDLVSFATLNAQEWLEKQNLNENEEIIYSYTSASDSSISILLNDQAHMSIMSLPNYLKLSDEIKQKVHVIYQSEPKPSRICLAKEKNGITLEKWEEALKSFSESAEGKNHLEITKLEAFRPISKEDLENLDEMVKKTIERLNN